MPRSRYRFVGNDAPYFMTMTVNSWLPVFTRPQTVEILLDCWRYLREHHAFRLHGYVVSAWFPSSAWERFPRKLCFLRPVPKLTDGALEAELPKQRRPSRAWAPGLCGSFSSYPSSRLGTLSRKLCFP